MGNALIWMAVIFSLPAFAQGDVKKISKTAALEAATVKPAASYPAIAKQLKIEGTVEVEVLVTEEGTVEQVTIVSGNPVLTKSAVETVKRWKFRAFQEEGKPIKVLAPLSFIFKYQ